MTRLDQPRVRLLIAALLSSSLMLVAAGCDAGSGGDGGSTTDRSGDDDRASVDDPSVAPSLALRPVGSFAAPVHAVAVPGTDLVAVVEKGGRVVVVDGMACQDADRCPDEPVRDGSTVVDLRGDVGAASEQGLLGLAFHPDWPDDERIYLNYTDVDGTTHVDAWTLATPTARARRQQELLRIRQPYANHNGGHLAFGPDGLLYVGMGDGGAGGDPEDRAQEDDELLGKMLRLDVDRGGERGFAIPDGNLRRGAREAWALGLRNPWRYSFDSSTGDLWIGDVGQDEWEELDVIAADRLRNGPTPNFGWRRFEGYEEFDDSGALGPGRLEQPVLAYGRDEGCSITGGVVYRGELLDELRGWYVFADFCGDDLRLLRADGVPGGEFERGELAWASRGEVGQVVSIAEVQRGELLVVSIGGTISQVVPG